MSERILVIDDTSETCELIKYILEHSGYGVLIENQCPSCFQKRNNIWVRSVEP